MLVGERIEVASLSILFNNRSFQTPDPVPLIFDAFLKRRIWERMVGRNPYQLTRKIPQNGVFLSTSMIVGKG